MNAIRKFYKKNLFIVPSPIQCELEAKNHRPHTERHYVRDLVRGKLLALGWSFNYDEEDSQIIAQLCRELPPRTQEGYVLPISGGPARREGQKLALASAAAERIYQHKYITETEDEMFLCPHPVKIFLQGSLTKSRYADGWATFSIGGLNVNRDIAEKILNKSISFSDMLDLNLALSAAIMSEIGVDKLAKRSKASIISRCASAELIEFPWRTPIRALLVRWLTKQGTSESTIIFVPPEYDSHYEHPELSNDAEYVRRHTLGVRLEDELIVEV